MVCVWLVVVVNLSLIRTQTLVCLSFETLAVGNCPKNLCYTVYAERIVCVKVTRGVIIAAAPLLLPLPRLLPYKGVELLERHAAVRLQARARARPAMSAW